MLHTRQMAHVVAHGPWRWPEFVSLDESDPRELIEGELVEIDVPTDPHEYVVTMLAFFLTAWARPRKAGYALVSGYKVRIDDRRGVMLDVQFYRDGNKATRSRQALEAGHPDLVVEVILETSAKHDRTTKLGYYARIGVPEYWIVDPGARTLERLQLQREEYALSTFARNDDLFRPETFEGLEVPLAELWTIPETGSGAGPARIPPARS